MAIEPILSVGDLVISEARVALVDAMLANAPVQITRRDNGLFHGLDLWETIAIRQCLAHSDKRRPCVIVHADDATVYETALSDLVAETTFARISETTPKATTERLASILALHPLSSCILLNGLLNRIPNPKSLLAQHLEKIDPGALLIVLVMVNNSDHDNANFNFDIGFAPLSIGDFMTLDSGTLVRFGTQSREFPNEWPQCVSACAAFRREPTL